MFSAISFSIILIILIKTPLHFCGLVLFYIIEKSHKMITDDEGYHTAANLKTKVFENCKRSASYLYISPDNDNLFSIYQTKTYYKENKIWLFPDFS